MLQCLLYLERCSELRRRPYLCLFTRTLRESAGVTVLSGWQTSYVLENEIKVAVIY